MEELLAVSVTILGRTYRLKIEKSKEEALRKAATRIDQQANLYAKNYVYRDNQDLLAMVALSQITELTQIQDNLKFKDQTLVDKLAEIDSALEEYLHAAQNSL